MISFPSHCRIYMAIEPINMNSSFDRLSLLVEEIIKQSPLNGHLFVFRNKQRDKIKLLLWDRNGFWIYYRRLERGRFKIPKIKDQYIELSHDDLRLLLDGIDIEKLKRFPELHFSVVG
jgi:transposase